MKWLPWKRPTPAAPHEIAADLRLAKAEEQAQQLTERAERVIPHLVARHSRNHWTETAQSIARGRHA